MGVNKVILIGNLGRDPEIRRTANQVAVANFSLATGERRKNSAGEWEDHTEWHRVVAFGNLAEFCGNYLKKGRQVYVEGKIRTNKWQDREGQDRYTTEILANTVQFVGRKEASEGVSVEVATENVAPGPAGLESVRSADALQGGTEEVPFDDDDIPF